MDCGGISAGGEYGDVICPDVAWRSWVDTGVIGRELDPGGEGERGENVRLARGGVIGLVVAVIGDRGLPPPIGGWERYCIPNLTGLGATSPSRA